MELFDSLSKYLDIDCLGMLYLTNKSWHNYINNNLRLLSINLELPLQNTFGEIYISSFWSANELLHYSITSDDSRMKEIAYKRHSVKPEQIWYGYRSFIQTKTDIKAAYELILSHPLCVKSVKMFQKLANDNGITSTKFREDKWDLTKGLEWELLSSENYELLIYLTENDYIPYPTDLEFREFCITRGLTALVDKISEVMIQEVIRCASVTRKDSIAILEEYKWDISDAIVFGCVV